MSERISSDSLDSIYDRPTWPKAAPDAARARDEGYERRRAVNSHGRPAEQRERQGHGLPVDDDTKRALEREPQYRGTNVGGFTRDRGRNIENLRPAENPPPLRGDERLKGAIDAENRRALEDVRRLGGPHPDTELEPHKQTHVTEEKTRERGSTRKTETNR